MRVYRVHGVMQMRWNYSVWPRRRRCRRRVSDTRVTKENPNRFSGKTCPCDKRPNLTTVCTHDAPWRGRRYRMARRGKKRNGRRVALRFTNNIDAALLYQNTKRVLRGRYRCPGRVERTETRGSSWCTVVGWSPLAGVDDSTRDTASPVRVARRIRFVHVGDR